MHRKYNNSRWSVPLNARTYKKRPKNLDKYFVFYHMMAGMWLGGTAKQVDEFAMGERMSQ